MRQPVRRGAPVGMAVLGVAVALLGVASPAAGQTVE